jgi:hypothetical protein
VFVPPSDAEAKELCSSGTSVGWATGACSLGVDAESGLESSLQGANPVAQTHGLFMEITVKLACAKASMIPSKLGNLGPSPSKERCEPIFYDIRKDHRCVSPEGVSPCRPL